MRQLGLIALFLSTTALAAGTPAYDPPPIKYDVKTAYFNLVWAGQAPTFRGNITLSCSRIYDFRVNDKTRTSVMTFVAMFPDQLPLVCTAPQGVVIPPLSIPTGGLVSLYFPRPQ